MEDYKIPTNLEECFTELDDIFKEMKKPFKEDDEEAATVNLHHSLGRMLRNEWGLWSGSELKSFFTQKGIEHADDMSGIILTSYHRHINGRDIKLDEQIKFYQDFWKQSKS